MTEKGVERLSPNNKFVAYRTRMYWVVISPLDFLIIA